MSDDSISLACQIQDPAQQRQRTAEVQALFKQSIHREELIDGYAFYFPNQDRWAMQLLEFILFEKNCCPFFTFALIFAEQHGALQLHLRGSAEVKAIIEAQFMATG